MRSIRAPARPYWANSVRAALRIVSRSSLVVRTGRSYPIRTSSFGTVVGMAPFPAPRKNVATKPIDIDAVMNHPRRVQRLRGVLDRVHDGIAPLIDISLPYVS